MKSASATGTGGTTATYGTRSAESARTIRGGTRTKDATKRDG